MFTESKEEMDAKLQEINKCRMSLRHDVSAYLDELDEETAEAVHLWLKENSDWQDSIW